MLLFSLMIDLDLQEDMPIVYVNHVFEIATGYSAAEVLDMHKRTVLSIRCLSWHDANMFRC